MPVPDFYTVEEAADILRIGRTAAYQAAKQYRQTGVDGLPVVVIRGSLRVPRRLLEAMAGGPLTRADDEPAPVVEPRRAVKTQRAIRPKVRTSHPTADSTEQRPLPFTR